MDSKTEEEYVFLVFATGDISQALSGLMALPGCSSSKIKYALLRDSIVAYCRSFTTCRGKFGRLRLKVSDVVPSSLLALHEELFALRDQVFAHTDLEPRNPILHMWQRPLGNIFPIQSKGYDYAGILAKVVDIEELFKTTLGQIESKIAKLEIDFTKK